MCLVAHIFVLNDWSNLTADLTDPYKAASVFTARALAAARWRGWRSVCWSSASFSSLASALATFLVALGIAALSALLLAAEAQLERPSAPQLGRRIWPEAPCTSSSAIAWRTASIAAACVTAVFFGLTFAAGHLTQELRDYHGDSLNTIRTNAVIFGQRRTFAASLALFTLAQVLLLFLALQGTLPRALAAIVLLYPIHLRWSLQTLSEGLTTPSICRLQARYRALYGIVGVAMVAALWLD